MNEMQEELKEAKKQGIVKTFLNFDKMLTPVIIKIIFYIGLVVSILAGLLMIFSGVTSYYGGGAQVFAGILVLVLSPIGVRVYCELLIVIFKINENLVELNNKK